MAKGAEELKPSDVLVEHLMAAGAQGDGEDDGLGALLLEVVKSGDLDQLRTALSPASPAESLVALMNWLHKWQQEYQCVMESLTTYLESAEDNEDLEDHAAEMKEMDVEAQEILAGFEKLALALVAQCPDQVDAMDDLGWTLLMQAANCGSLSLVSALLAAGADRNVRQHHQTDGMHALARAIDACHVDVVQVLVTPETINATFAYKNVDDEDADVEQHTPLTFACHGKDDIAAFLLTHEALDINAHVPETGDTALHIAVCYDNVELVSKLLAKDGLDINAVNEQGYTAAFGCSNPDLVALLLANGLDAGILGNEGETALDLALALQDEDVAAVLAEHTESSSNQSS
ncbi:hypothetical protein SPRG_15261 [Saprolegnia parasitica CBS 223.65]|uniref:Uncharacterized protein n=1 Tax=Saprolegnia parasitica (strain CBS 223.65) TaxID=695850 RepID=A0A067BS25_SAPPC|nr:hypothetical protein SPRG_15261 [Saprolegnia parasitica CBS 223.65]KDO19600.1 hypothetical protein SPRG_15261 [Saprolegnia parasitica CBS 223.65]|eukprot:XP_012209696.1 hypothetical protein SPRG_15261 [Saprolegnia parasitica CBS 223.65]